MGRTSREMEEMGSLCAVISKNSRRRNPLGCISCARRRASEPNKECQLREKGMNELPYQRQIEIRPNDDDMAGVVEDFTGTRSEAEREAAAMTNRCPFFPRALVFHRCGPALNHEWGAPAP